MDVTEDKSWKGYLPAESGSTFSFRPTYRSYGLDLTTRRHPNHAQLQEMHLQTSSRITPRLCVLRSNILLHCSSRF